MEILDVDYQQALQVAASFNRQFRTHQHLFLDILYFSQKLLIQDGTLFFDLVVEWPLTYLVS